MALAIVPARADETQVTWGRDYFAVLPGYAIPSRAYQTTGSGFTISGIYGYQLASHWAVEGNVQGSVFETGLNKGTDYYENGVTGDVVFLLRDRHAGLFTPFVLAGIGGVYDDFYPNSRDGVAFIADAGIGIVTQPLFSNGIRFRIDARYVYDTHEGGHGGGRVLAGLEIPLGRVERQVVYVQGKTEVREVVREVIKEVPRPFKDSDGDGVDDEHDQCPDTPPGMRVDAHGCIIETQTIELRGVTFEFNEARLTPNAMSVLDMTSRAFIGQPSLRAQVAGHTDSVGSTAANQRLSQLRAQSVRAYLISKGVRPEQLTAQGFGKSQLLINPEASAQDREHNRRVELRVLVK